MTKPDLMAELAEVVRLSERATPGPWLFRPKSNSWHKPPPDGTAYSYGEYIMGAGDDDENGNGYDEQFMVAAMHLMSTPGLLSAIDAALAFIQGCANSAGGDVDGDHLAARAKCLLATFGTNEAKTGDWMLECDGYKTYWPTFEIAERERVNLAILGHRATVTPSNPIYNCSHCGYSNHAGTDHADCDKAAELNTAITQHSGRDDGASD